LQEYKWKVPFFFVTGKFQFSDLVDIVDFVNFASHNLFHHPVQNFDGASFTNCTLNLLH
jgi:hypothetical protein